MIVLGFPNDPTFGWTAGWVDLAREMRKLTPIAAIGQEGDYPADFDAPVIDLIRNYTLLPCNPHVRSRKRNIGFGFPEETELIKRYALNGRRWWHHLVGGSTWCADSLRAAGLDNVSAIVQGVDCDRFCPGEPRDEDGHFVIYSGGKAEFRKSQDIVLKAVGVMMQRHADVYLVADWHNPWQFSFDTLRATALFSGGATIEDAAVVCGVDLKRANINMQLATLDQMRAHYRAADVALFPNRAEAGTNMPLMQCMACGTPAIATYAHGHKDVIHLADPFALRDVRDLLVCDQNGRSTLQTAMWFEPSMEETVEALEMAYRERETLPAHGLRQREVLKQFTWAKCAREFVELCNV